MSFSRPGRLIQRLPNHTVNQQEVKQSLRVEDRFHRGDMIWIVEGFLNSPQVAPRPGWYKQENHKSMVLPPREMGINLLCGCCCYLTCRGHSQGLHAVHTPLRSLLPPVCLHSAVTRRSTVSRGSLSFLNMTCMLRWTWKLPRGKGNVLPKNKWVAPMFAHHTGEYQRPGS